MDKTLIMRIYGASDDLVEIEVLDGGEWMPLEEIGAYNSDVQIKFPDGTVILCGYPKRSGAIWWIKIENTGTADHTFTECNDEDADIYSDVFQIELEKVNSRPILYRKSETEEFIEFPKWWVKNNE